MHSLLGDRTQLMVNPFFQEYCRFLIFARTKYSTNLAFSQKNCNLAGKCPMSNRYFSQALCGDRIKDTIYRPIRKMVVILFSFEINFTQGNHCRVIEYFKTTSFTKYRYNIPCILFEKWNRTGVCARISKEDWCFLRISKGSNFACMDCFNPLNSYTFL